LVYPQYASTMYASFRGAPKTPWLTSPFQSNTPSHHTFAVQNETVNLSSPPAQCHHNPTNSESTATPPNPHDYDSIPASPHTAGNGSLKRRHRDKENRSPRKRTSAAVAEGHRGRHYTPRRTIQQKLGALFELIHELDWTLADFLYYTFRTTDEHGNDICRTRQHAKSASHFLQGLGKFSPAHIVGQKNLWFASVQATQEER
jgi:hypothetical protein